ncbi:MAG TPA: maleylpyruvate isomerase family mycothiol-dependent enzyme [Micromonosporaceae bacterium]|nr:maleylpyruvate isomerase family mycothiol-dependent enzyme [Micromonosporaceae bacterium]
MEMSRYLACLWHDAARLRAIAVDNLELSVPSCPGWTVADLIGHVAEAYQHKTECIRQGKLPKPWPPPPTGEEPVERFDRSLSELLAEFDKHQPTDAAGTWYTPDQSVGFWIRRMAQETVIHRVDAELAISDVTAIPTDLALDGVDEVLGIFLGWAPRTFGARAQSRGPRWHGPTSGSLWCAATTRRGRCIRPRRAYTCHAGPPRTRRRPSPVTRSTCCCGSGGGPATTSSPCTATPHRYLCCTT